MFAFSLEPESITYFKGFKVSAIDLRINTFIHDPIPSPEVAQSVPYFPSRAEPHQYAQANLEDASHPDIGTLISAHSTAREKRFAPCSKCVEF